MGTAKQRRDEFRNAVNSPEIVVAPGAVDALTARLVEQAGFPVVYATGAGIVNSQLAIPDLGLASMAEILEQVRRIISAVALPVIADIDTGFGNPVNVYRTVHEFDRAGVAALQLEDQVNPKKCGHFAGKELVTIEEMTAKIRIAKEAGAEDGPLLIARTDAIAIEGVRSAISRADAYARAGADLLFVEAPETVEDLTLIPKEVNLPLVVNMTEGGKTPMVPTSELQHMGYSLVIYPNVLLRSAAFAVRHALNHLYQSGSTIDLQDRMLSWDERQSLVGIEHYSDLERRFVLNVEVED